MLPAITLEALDELTVHLNLEEDVLKSKLFKMVRGYYKEEEDLKRIKSIKTEEIIQELWPLQDPTKKDLKDHIKTKRKELSALKLKLNNQCRDLYWEDKNPPRTGIGRFNTFTSLKTTKHEELKKAKAEASYLRNIVNEISPDELIKLIESSPEETIEKIKKALELQKARGDLDEESVLREQDLDDLDKELPPKKEQEGSKSLLDAQKQLTQLAEELEKLEQASQGIKDDIESKKLTADEESDRIFELHDEKEKMAKTVAELLKNIKDLSKTESPELSTAVEAIQNRFKDLIEDKQSGDINALQGIAGECLEALGEFNKADQGDLDDTQQGGKGSKSLHDVEELIESTKDLTKTESPELSTTVEAMQNRLQELMEDKKSSNLDALQEIADECRKALGKCEAAERLDTPPAEMAPDLEKLSDKQDLSLEDKVQLTKSSMDKLASQLDTILEDFNALQEKEDQSAQDFAMNLESIVQKGQEIYDKMNASKEDPSIEDEESTDSGQTLERIQSLNDRSREIAEELNKINTEFSRIQKEIAEKEISTEQAAQEIQKLEESRESLIEQALLLDQEIKKARKNIEEAASAPSDQEADTSKNEDAQTCFKEAFSKEEEAMQDFHHGEELIEKMKDSIEDEDLLNRFMDLKEETKDLTREFQSVDNEIAELRTQENKQGALTEEEKQKLQEAEQKRSDLENKGSELVKDLEDIASQGNQGIKEAAESLINCQEKFINDIKNSLHDQIEEMLSKKGEEASEEGDRIPELMKGELEKSQDTMKELINHLINSGELFSQMNSMFSQSDENLGEKEKEALKQFAQEHKKFEEIAQSVSDDIEKCLAGVGVEKEEEPEIGDMVDIEGSFYIDRFPVTIAMFNKFVEETGYITYAEKIGYSWVYQKGGWCCHNDNGRQQMVFQRAALGTEKGASWKNPVGISKDFIEMSDAVNCPVVHVTYLDALEYARWKGCRLPTPKEWMLAAFSRKKSFFPWGDTADTDKCNHRQSDFQSVSPVDSFDPNPCGIFDLIGNIWEWCETPDQEQKIILGGCWNMKLEEIGRNIRQHSKPMEHNNTIGFRCVKDK